MSRLLIPQALLGLILPLSLAAYYLLRRPKPRGLPIFVSHIKTLSALSRVARWKMRGLFFIALAGMIFLIVAAAHPVQDHTHTQHWTEGIDIALVVDISESMEATDFSPNRMYITKSVLKSFIDRRKHDRISLILFGGEAVTKSPLTRDYDFLRRQIDDIRFRELKQGTAIGMGLLGGVSRLRNSRSKTRIVILMTDGDSNVGTINPITAANLARQEGIKIYTIGIGQNDRVLVPIYAYDSSGKRGQLLAKIPSYLNPDLLARIARMTGGNAYMARDSNTLSRIVSEIDTLETTKLRVRQQTHETAQFRIPLLLGMLILLLACVSLETRFRQAHAV